MSADRYDAMFTRLAQDKCGAFIPFTVLGDPDPAESLEIVRTLVHSGADALELGIPFSDPVADGPVIQAADIRALASGVRLSHVWGIIQAVRQEFAELPIGLLVYANLVESNGAATFFRSAKRAGVDSVLIADVPSIEVAPYADAAHAEDILPVMIATNTATAEQLRVIARTSKGYTYVVTRLGVTGVDQSAQANQDALVRQLAELGAPPAVLGFGISTPAHVRAAIQSGAAGAISGSAVVSRIARHREDPERMHRELAAFTRTMSDATGS